MKSCKRACALGFFDGVHLGHGEIIKTAKALGEALDAVPCVLTFDRKPKTVLTGEKEKLISSSACKEKLVSSLFGGVEFMVYPFTEELAALSAEQFIESVLIGQIGAVAAAAGRDYRFGKGALGDIEFLKTKLKAESVDTVLQKGEKVSSTLIRQKLSQGEFDSAVSLLGHPFLLGGQVFHGDGRGHNIGFATLNLPYDENQLYPQRGVYASFTQVGGEIFPSVTNLGNRPTFYDEGVFTNETHLIGASADLYGKDVWVWLCAYLRPERRFDSSSALKAQVDVDISRALNVYNERSALIEKIRRNFK